MIQMRQVFSHQAHRLGMQMGSRLRAGDLMECAAAGMTGYEAITESLKLSALAFGAFDGGFDGAPPLALWGVCAQTMLGDHGRLWFLTADGVERHKKLLLRASRDFVQFAESQYPRLEAIVHRDYDAATRWLRWLGFRLEPLPDLGGDFCRARIGF